LEVLRPFIKNEAKDTKWRPYEAPATETNTAAATFLSRVISGFSRGVYEIFTLLDPEDGPKRG